MKSLVESLKSLTKCLKDSVEYLKDSAACLCYNMAHAVPISHGRKRIYGTFVKFKIREIEIVIVVKGNNYPKIGCLKIKSVSFATRSDTLWKYAKKLNPMKMKHSMFIQRVIGEKIAPYCNRCENREGKCCFKNWN